MVNLNMSSFGEVGEILVDVQTEIVFFALAFVTHLVFFSRFRPAGLKSKKCHVDSVNSPSMKQQNRKGAARNNSLVAFKTALRAGDAKSAMYCFEELQALSQQSGSTCAPYNLLEQLVKLAAQTGTLLELLRLFSKLGLLASTLKLVLAESAEKGDAASLKEAQQLGRAQGVKFTSAFYQALIKGACTCGTRKEAEQAMSEAWREDAADIGTYSAYVIALLKWGRTQELGDVMESMRASGLKPDVVAFNHLLEAAVTSTVDNTWSLMEEMKAFGVKPDQATCTILLKSRCAKSRATNLEQVASILGDLDGVMDEALFTQIVDACVRVGRSDILKSILYKQRTSNCVALKTSHAYGSIIRACGFVQDIQGAWDAWYEMKKQHIVPISVTAGCMVEAVVQNGDLEGGYKLIQEMRNDEKTAPLVNAVMYGSIVKGFSHSKCFNRVWEVYDEMVSQKLKFSMVTYNTLIDSCARSGELERIPSLLKDIEAQGLKMCLVTYSTILKGYCQKDMLADAFEMFETLEKSAEYQPDEIMYNILLDGCARRGLLTQGLALFEKMKKSGVRPSNYTLSVLVKLANRAKKIEKAFELCDELSSTYKFRLNTHVFANLVQTCIAHKDLPRAIGVLERMVKERVQPDIRSYSLLLKACIEERASSDAAGLLRAAMGVGEPHPQLAKFALTALQPQGGLPGDLVSEILLGLMDVCREERLAASLFAALPRGMKLDQKLRLRLAARMGNIA